MSHSAGLPGFSRPFTIDELYDWDRCCADLPAQATWWEPGTQSGYHAATQGYLIGEVVRRITGHSIGRFFKREVAKKVGADFQIGTDPVTFDRIADMVAPKEAFAIPAMDPASIPGRVFTGFAVTPEVVASTAWRQAEVPAGNGHGNARSIVRAQTAMANGASAFGGAGGSTVVVDTDARVCFSYVMNQMDYYIIGGPRGRALTEAVYESLAAV
jgi:CubicO group peptidase (beta-lactamase class C family)